jgi:hypothetical protein
LAAAVLSSSALKPSARKLPALELSALELSARIVAALALSASVQAQNHIPHYSVTWHGPTVGVPDSLTGFPITEGDVLTPPGPPFLPAFGPLAAPAIQAKAGPGAAGPHLGLALHPPCMGHPGGTPCRVEVDALCDGQSLLLPPNLPVRTLFFSTDKYAVGFGAPVPPSLTSEAPVGESAADVMVNLGTAPGPLPPFAGPMAGHTAVLDGDGVMGPSAFLYRGLGIQEPSLPGPALPDTGDNLDALMFRDNNAATTPWPMFGIFFSLDAAFPDPLTGLPNTGSALAHGFQGADILNTPVPGGAPLLWCPAPMLGLDVLGPGSDDLDALVICENGVAGYQPANGPYGWLAGTDMVLFSVRRGSAVIGAPDSIFGLPISEGDILIPPAPGSLNPFPGIFFAAENLGLQTARNFPGALNDELDALDIPTQALYDCNGNGREDALDIRFGPSLDANNNGIPDECEPTTLVTPFCFCPAPLGPCGNDDATAGCQNSTGIGALMSAAGSTSVGLDNLVLTTSQMPAFRQCITIMSANLSVPLPFYDGRRCLQSPMSRFGVQNSGAGGTTAIGPGLAAYSVANFLPANWIVAGSTFGFQTWYRDSTGPCGTGSNMSSAISATFVP